MGYINIFVSNDAHICVKDNQLTLQNKFQKVDYPLEDINSIMIESLATTLSTYTLSKFAEYGICCFVCNQNHLPNGVLLPYCEHYQTLLQYNTQISTPKPLQKQLWQTIIKNKIQNQNLALEFVGKKDLLKNLQQSVLSGDSTNNEAKASLIYFKELFGDYFKRREDNNINAFLNYGYSILRGVIARTITVHGLMPFLGVFHCNQYNQFNLADDMIEVFRPIVDLYVKTQLFDVKNLDTQTKGELFGLLNYNVLVEGQIQTVSYAI